MSEYAYITKFNSGNYTRGSSAPKVFGRKRTISAITIHHWGIRGQSFYGVVNFLCRKGGTTSAHEVIEAGRVAVIVDHKNAAWHSGSAKGNATTIGLELRPEATEADYATAAQRIADLRKEYGNIPLIPHSAWKATACPGSYDLARLDREARQAASGITVKPSTPAKPKPKPNAKPSKPKKQPTNYANLVVDGNAGARTIDALQIVMRAIKTYSRAVDGQMGKHTVKAVQKWLRGAGEYPANKYLVDGKFGPETIKALQRFLAKRGHLDTKKWLIDGKFGKETIKALQRYLNTQN